MSEPQWFYLGAWAPFDGPVAPPDTLFTDAPRVSLCFNKKWLPYVVAALKSLVRPESWNVDPSTLATMRADLWTGISAWKDECVSDIMFRQSESCLLQISFDGGTTWATIFDASTCVHALVPNTKAPALLGPPPSLTCTNYDVECPANAPAELPVLLNAGDTVRIVSHTNDVWTDDAVAALVDTDHFYCADGTHVDLVPGFCGAAEPAHSGDPLLTANHMELLLVVNGVYYRVLAGTVTIPSGVANARGYLVPNDSILYDNFFAQSAVVEICTNRWYHTFDFSLGSALGWTNARHMPFVGDGFEADADNVDCNVDSPTMTTGVVTFFEHFYDPPLQCGPTNDHCAYKRSPDGCFGPETFSCGSDFLEDVGANTTHYDVVSCYTHNRSDVAETPKHKLVKVILGGTGTEPIWP